MKYRLIDHRLLKGDSERETIFDTLEGVKEWLGADYAWCESEGDVNDQLREESDGIATYELFEIED